jgi:hypothetical protein
MNNNFTESLIRHIEHKLPADFLPEKSSGDKILIILDVWQSMKDKIAEQETKIEGAVKDLEYTLNLLNVAESNLSDEHAELKKGINHWLDYYRNLSKQEK